MTQAKRRDIFAGIARDFNTSPQPESDRREPLVAITPPELPQRVLPSWPGDPAAAFEPRPRLESAEQLAAELVAYRGRYAPFLADLAPAAEPARIAVPLVDFDWRIEGEGDNWQRVTIPHYGGPLGRATAYYRTGFEVTAEMLAKGAVFVHFNGVDYKTHVFVNDAYLGSHEGFFAAFEFECTSVVHPGTNTLLVRVENDAILMGNESWGEHGELYEGDKIYAATGPGYDDPAVGWHHCPPGMGIYQDVCVEARAPIHIHDIYVRPVREEARGEAWIEVYNTGRLRCPVAIELSLYGQNFAETVFEREAYELSGPAGPTVNYYRLPFEMPAPRVWEPDAPWLYQLQVRLLDEYGQTLDARARQFGMRSFVMTGDPYHQGNDGEDDRGRFYLNGREIKLRGANTMGFEQQDVMRKDWDQLRDDILLAKICHMNYWRLTQRPVQAEVYDYCDRLGLLTQTDLPLFGVLRRNQFNEAVREAGEMERLVRGHPCNIMVTYINEPFPTGWGKLHRQVSRPELERFFEAASHAVLQENPDRVIKPVDGDYDPPGPSLPDNHCYCGWYNGHGVDLGSLNRGYWQKVKPGWRYGCGEFGAEGLDPVNVMRSHYPPDWLPQSDEEERSWTPDRIVGSQTGRFHYLWFDTQHSVADWVRASQAHQAWVTRLMTEAFRRDARMSSIAIHLFIDAFPSGWMKTIMDVERQPKPAFFAYRDALSPLLANLRTDRTAFWSGETMRFEAWVCNDFDAAVEGAELRYQLEIAGAAPRICFSQAAPAMIPACAPAFQGYIDLVAPEVAERTRATVRLAVVSATGEVLHDTAVEIELFPRIELSAGPVAVIDRADGPAGRLAQELGVRTVGLEGLPGRGVILVGDMERYVAHADAAMAAVEAGATAVFLDLPVGKHQIAGETLDVQRCGMSARHFVSRATGHPLVGELQPTDFRFWYDADAGHVTPLLATTFTAEGWQPILMSGNGDWSSGWGPALAAAEKPYGAGTLRVCQVALAGRTTGNPTARIFAARLLGSA
jgi:hypothetical protein